jgi:mono/diheme cytochrome c family protein
MNLRFVPMRIKGPRSVYDAHHFLWRFVLMNLQKTASMLALTLLAGATLCLAQSSGEGVYKAKCQMCHGATGLADTPAAKALKVKPFNDPILIRMSDVSILKLTREGTGKMPAFQGKLTDGEMTEVVAYIHQLQKK